MAKFFNKPHYVTPAYVEKLAKVTQSLYLSKAYEALLPKAMHLRECASFFPQFTAFILTSHIWTIKALQALGRDTLKEAIATYSKDAHKLKHPAHIAQAAQFRLEYSIKHFLFEEALDALDETLEVLKGQPQCAGIAIQAAEIEIACTHFDAARKRLDQLSQDFKDDNATLCVSNRLQYAIAYTTDETEKANDYLSKYFKNLDSCSKDSPELMEAVALKANLAHRQGNVISAKASRNFLKEVYDAADPVDENALNNAIQLAELEFYAGNIQSALSQLDVLSDIVFTNWPAQNAHICRTLALSRCQLSLDVDTTGFSPETCLTRLHSVTFPSLPTEDVCAKLIECQAAILRKKFTGIEERLTDLKNTCQFQNLNVCHSIIDVTRAELYYEVERFDEAFELILKAEENFERRMDLVSAARARSRRIQIHFNDIELENRLHQEATHFLETGHREIALTIFLAIANARLKRHDSAGTRKALELAEPLIVKGFMTQKEVKSQRLLNELS